MFNKNVDTVDFVLDFFCFHGACALGSRQESAIPRMRDTRHNRNSSVDGSQALVWLSRRLA